MKDMDDEDEIDKMDLPPQAKAAAIAAKAQADLEKYDIVVLLFVSFTTVLQEKN